MKAQLDKQNGGTNKDVAQNQNKDKENQSGENGDESEEGKTRKKSDKNMRLLQDCDCR